MFKEINLDQSKIRGLVIEGNWKIPATENNYLIGGLDIQQAEEWEDRLDRLKVQYLLVYAAVPRWVYVSDKKDRLLSDPTYHIFVKDKNELARIAGIVKE